MPQYLRISENIYRKFKENDRFTDNKQDCLNLIIKQIRKELVDTDLKLIYNYIDFVDGFEQPFKDRRMTLDISLIPSYKHKDEFVLWLAGFIEKITEGGVKRLAPIHANIPPEFTFQSDPNVVLDIRNEHSGERIISYFRSDDFAEEIKNI
ncbi:hypothetical protein F892_02464 [Acinetobacter vivianii]|uniref:Uncharacterized protein n=1 Tax=Acinetobacter vivianii TaxID=1776742 RepID=N9Q8F6_9GAMM|nr:hypothetical protein [Acinetobacter vivianii]ENX23217.1 hypothetical protein F892_02464 [Acinetobacter vivianii]GGI60467.1 hypothetical protein GCM10011446_19620 [Acinetobacter vivianii]